MATKLEVKVNDVLINCLRAELDLKTINQGHQMFTLIVDNYNGVYNGSFHAQDLVEVHINDILYIKGYIDTVKHLLTQDRQWSGEDYLRITGRDLSQDFSNKKLIKTYPDSAKLGDIIRDAMDATEITKPAAGLGPTIGGYTADDEYLLDLVRKVLEQPMVNWEGFVGTDKTLEIFPMGTRKAGGQDFYTYYTEVDPNSKLAQSPNRATWTDMIRNEACYLYRAIVTPSVFTHTFDFQLSVIDVNADQTNNVLAIPWIVCETSGRPATADVGKSIYLEILEVGNSTTLFQLYLTHKDDTVQDTSINLDVGTTYYLTITKVGAVVTVYIYNESGRTTLKDTLTIDLTGEDEANINFSYIEVTGSFDSAADGNDQSDGFVENFGEAIIITDPLSADFVEEDGLDIRNIITVYGAPILTYPELWDEWTEYLNSLYDLDEDEVITSNTSYELVSTVTLTPLDPVLPIHVSQVEIEVQRYFGERKYRIRYQLEGGAETDIVTDQDFSAFLPPIRWDRRVHATDITGAAGNWVKINFYVKVASGIAYAKTRRFKTIYDSLEPSWTLDIGTALFLTAADKRVGNYGIEATSAGTDIVKLTLAKPFSVRRGEHKSLRFWHQVNAGAVQHDVRLLTTATDYFYYEGNNNTVYTFKELPLGPENEYDSENNPDGIWKKTGSPDWFNIIAIQFYYDWAVAGILRLDGLYLYPRRCRGEATDTSSGTTYQTREFSVYDDKIRSNEECQARAEALMDAMKDTMRKVRVTIAGTDFVGAGKEAVTEDLNVNGQVDDVFQWSKVGTTPYLDAADDPTNKITHTVVNHFSRYFTFPSITVGKVGRLVSAKLYYRIKCAIPNQMAKGEIWNGTMWSDQPNQTIGTTYSYIEYDVSAHLNSISKVNVARCAFRIVTGGGNLFSIDHAYLRVTYIPSGIYEGIAGHYVRLILSNFNIDANYRLTNIKIIVAPYIDLKDGHDFIITFDAVPIAEILDADRYERIREPRAITYLRGK